MSPDDRDIANLSVVVVMWNVLLHTEMKQVLLPVSCSASIAPNVLARDYMFLDVKWKRPHGNYVAETFSNSSIVLWLVVYRAIDQLTTAGHDSEG